MGLARTSRICQGLVQCVGVALMPHLNGLVLKKSLVLKGIACDSMQLEAHLGASVVPHMLPTKVSCDTGGVMIGVVDAISISNLKEKVVKVSLKGPLNEMVNIVALISKGNTVGAFEASSYAVLVGTIVSGPHKEKLNKGIGIVLVIWVLFL